MPGSEWEIPYRSEMIQASHFHSHGQYTEARLHNIRAFRIAPEGSSLQGRAARDIAAQYDRSGDITNTILWADRAYAIHDSLLSQVEDNMPDDLQEALRARGASALYCGVGRLRQDIQAQKAGQATEPTATLFYIRQAWTDLEQARRLARPDAFPRVDQFQINTARRVSIAEAIDGDRQKGLAVGAFAVFIAFASESPRFALHPNPKSTSTERLSAKTRALAGGLAALAVSVVTSKTSMPRRQLALRIASKTL